MKVGMITDVFSNNIGVYAKTWALQKVLKGFGITPIVIPQESKSEEAKNQEERQGIGSKLKNIFSSREEEKVVKEVKSEIKDVSEFVKSRFVICAGTDEVGTDKGLWQHMDHYVVTDASLYELLKKTKDEYQPIYYVSHAAMLINQKIYHEIAIKPTVTKDYMVVDIKKLDDKTKQFIEKFAKEKDVAIVQNRQYAKVAKSIASFHGQELEEYIGYIRHAKYVITDTYETTVMAFLHEKAFLSLTHNEDSDQIKEVLSLVKLSNHALKDLEKGDEIKAYDISNKTEFRNAIKTWREMAKKSLGQELKLEQFNLYVECPTNILKSECCGCSACKEVCPTNAITMVEDKEGFLYPVVNPAKCIDCKLCAKACVKRENPQTISYETSFPKILAAMNKSEEVRMGSSSGGVFPALVDYAINKKKGVVVGVKYDENMQVVSAIADNMEDAKAFYGAKYVKSTFSHVFPKIKELLEEGRFVLYSSLPCEAAGLKAYLRKPYENLVISEILCHASPSPKVFQKYVEYLNKKFKSEITNFNFRDKTKGWIAEDNQLNITFKDREPLKVNARKNNYYRSFAKDIIARPGCGNCSFVYKNRVGDITMGDFWGIRHTDPSMYDNKGTSIIMLNTPKGDEIFREISDQFVYKESDLVTAFQYNHKKPIVIKDARDEFFERLDKEPIDALLESYNDLVKKK